MLSVCFPAATGFSTLCYSLEETGILSMLALGAHPDHFTYLVLYSGRSFHPAYSSTISESNRADLEQVKPSPYPVFPLDLLDRA